MGWSSIVIGIAIGGSAVAASYLRGAANGLLTQEQYDRLKTMQDLRRVSRTMLILYGACILAVLVALGVHDGRLKLYGLVAFAVCAVAWLHITYFRSLRGLLLPPAYIGTVRRARFILYCGFLTFLVIRAFFGSQPG